LGPDPHTLNDLTLDGHVTGDPIQEKICSDMRLFSYGKGDGGGGPEFEMIELARRLGDLEGVARSSHTSVSAFMNRLEAGARELSVYAGELYLELHRGTLTNQHEIKRNNRLAEIALHTLELVTVHRGVRRVQPADGAAINPMTETLLVNQFHDILPGTCIHSVHQTSLAQTGRLIREAADRASDALETDGDPGSVTLYNPLGFSRDDVLYLPDRAGMRVAGAYAQQRMTNLAGEAKRAVYGAVLPAFGAVTLRWEPYDTADEASVFRWEGNALITPFARVMFDEQGAIASYVDPTAGRELRDPHGLPWNTFLLAEDVSAAWDNWDIDADLEAKYAPEGRLLSRQIISDGPVELRIRSRWALSERSFIEQDMVFYAHSPMIVFDTVLEWQETHRFLKTAFDTDLTADGARHEIQFGHIRRGNHRSTPLEKARFEVCNHKYTDLSEGGFGIALLNDCKYGVSVLEGSVRLSLHKGGNRPDREGDRGRHLCRYAILPHEGGFSAENVVLPAYMFNYFPLVKAGGGAVPSLVSADAPNIIPETVKPCEDADTAYILRMYESAGAYTNVTLSFGHPVSGIAVTNMLEETQREQPFTSGASGAHTTLAFRPFQIITLRIAYGA
jgi:alpha-mannosidase